MKNTVQRREGCGIMSTDIIPVHLISAFTAESQALESAGGTVIASGHGIMRCRKVKIGWAATRFLYRRK